MTSSPAGPPPPVDSPRAEPGPGKAIVRTLSLAVASALVVLDMVFPGPIMGILAVLAMAGLLAGLVLGLRRAASVRIRRRLAALIGADVLILLALLTILVARGYIVVAQFGAETPELVLDLVAAARLYASVFLVIAAVHGLSAAMPGRVARLALRLAQRPALLLAGSFAGMILVGTVALMMPFAVEDLASVSVVDSLFMITSAVCVTGLSVNVPGTTYTSFGELVILLSVQLGGIGIMTLAALAFTFARDTALSTQLRYAAMLDARTLTDLRTTVRSIVIGTLAIEATGAGLLYLQFTGDPRIGDASPAWLAVFHAVSAFCNAGFSLFSNGLVAFANDFGVQAVLMGLVVTGGIGFPVLRELVLRLRARAAWIVKRERPLPRRLSVATRVVLVTSLVLIVAGTVLALLLEFRGGFRHLPFGQRLLAALFYSVNTRTSGFNTIDIGNLTATTLLWTCVFMFIGGSPGSTAGGMKTTTFATIVATFWAELRGREPSLARRAIAPEVIRRAIAVAAISSCIVLIALGALTLTETHEFMKLLFETVAAFSTAGLSTGITGTLSVPGKLIVCLTMFVGRVGPLTIALAVAGTFEPRAPVRLAREDLPIG